ncbi:MAG: alpha-2-macroglobulin [Acidobacteriota bacterium]
MIANLPRRILLSLMILCSLVLVSATGLFLSNQTLTPPKGATAQSRPDLNWPAVDLAISEGRFNEALPIVDKILEQARDKGDTQNWTKALVRGVQLRMGLHGYETAVRFLRDEKWPEDRMNQAVLGMYYSQALQTYYSGYSWEINRREPVGTDLPADLKAWTRDQIFGEARRAYEQLWKSRTALGELPITQLSEYIQPNDYPAGVRNTLRDALSYFYVALLSNTSFWKPREENEIYQLDLPDLLSKPSRTRAAAAAGSPASQDPSASGAFPHPLIRTVEVLKDLESWHASAGRREAALEARLERLRRLHAAFSQEKDRKRIKAALEDVLAGYRDVPWWSMGQALLAEMVREEAEPGKLARARRIAQAGSDIYPDSTGGKRCLHIIKAIEQPDFSLESMASDAEQKRSVRVSHRNIGKLYLRAYRVDLPNRLTTARDYNLLLNNDEQWRVMQSAKPEAEWTCDLPATPDFETHHTYVTPPLRRTGYYVIIASANRSFTKQLNQLQGLNFILTNLVVLVREEAGDFEAQVLSGKTGQAVRGAELDLYRYDWRQGHRRVDTVMTGADGTARFRFAQGRSDEGYYYAHFLVARHGSDITVNANGVRLHGHERPGPVLRSLVYTDRSVYRPNQKVLWKILAFSETERQRFAPATSAQVRVSLVDANNQEIETRSVTTNEFGTASGDFLIPSGRVLGRWYLRTSAGNGMGVIRVEEYKRPTFEASLKDPDPALRLNRAAVVKGEARYYFGLPVTNGSVNWRVTREPVYPWWWGWYGWGGSGTRSQTIAVGTAPLAEDGTFQIAFSPTADERDAERSRAISYRYKVTADVTDEGGETQTAERQFRVGFVAVEARISPDRDFFRENSAVGVKIFRTSLDGAPLPGKGTWRLVSLVQPERAVPPADLPVLPSPAGQVRKSAEDVRTPGDMLRPRWRPEYSPEREMHSWADGPEKAHGELAHDAKGHASVRFERLEPGPYRLYYKTTDAFGVPFETFSELVVTGPNTSLALPALFMTENTSCKVGETARFLALSGLPGQPMFFEVYKDTRLIERRALVSGRDRTMIELPVTEADRGGFGVRLVTVVDHQLIEFHRMVSVPWDNKELKVEFSTFRDKLRPGGQETWKLTVKNPSGQEVGTKAAEVLAYMYDRSLEVFEPHNPPSLRGLWPYRAQLAGLSCTLGLAPGQVIWDQQSLPDYPTLREDELLLFSGYGIGGPGGRRGRPRFGGVGVRLDGAVAKSAVAAEMAPPLPAAPGETRAKDEKKTSGAEPDQTGTPTPLRADFSETAFWQPHLLTGPDGSVTIEFKVPDSVTSWNVWVHAFTRDLLGASLKQETRSVKDLMTRPYLPRFLREGDQAELKVVVNNAGETELQGEVTLDIVDPATEKSLLGKFALSPQAARRPFHVKAGGGTNVAFSLVAPPEVGSVAFKVIATAGDLSDGELRPLPLLPGRMHLSQSRFVTLRDQARRELKFEDLQKTDDPTRINDQMVVTVDAQLFYSVLSSLPYLVNYPYECTEQTLNRFLSSGILTSLYRDYPAVARMAEEFAKRTTRFETFDSVDPNRKMALEETPWLVEARGGSERAEDLTPVLDPRVAKAEKEAALARLRKAQTAIGGFPWWPGGPPSPYMTLYLMYGFAKAAEFGVEAPKDMVQRGWGYLALHFRENYKQRMIEENCCWEFLTFLNYVASCYPDASCMGDALTAEERDQILRHCFSHWKEHSPYSKCQLALTLKRMNRPGDAELVFRSVMDSAKTTPDEGTFWAPEDRAWLWYNDTIETHAFALRTILELTPADERKDGLVHWLFLNKKLNHWKSTRATAEVIYSLAHYLKAEGTLGNREEATVTIGPRQTRLVFEPDRYTGKKNQIVVPGDEVDAKAGQIVVEKPSQGLMFASATWHFSTERLPEEDRGDLLSVSRKYFRRETTADGFALKPLADGNTLQPGDEVEVQLSIRAKHPCEYVHLRDPRAACLEPGTAVSRYKWDLGIGWYEEVRDSGTNFFFEWLPQGEYTLKYRLRANMSGTFRVSPATLQSMYAPEFAAYSAGAVLKIGPGAAKATD